MITDAANTKPSVGNQLDNSPNAAVPLSNVASDVVLAVALSLKFEVISAPILKTIATRTNAIPIGAKSSNLTVFTS